MASSGGNSRPARNWQCFRYSTAGYPPGNPRGTRVSFSPCSVVTRLTNVFARAIALISGHVFDDVLADLDELRRLRRIHAAANPHPARRNLEIQSRALCRARPFHGNTAAACVFSGVLSSLNRVSR